MKRVALLFALALTASAQNLGNHTDKLHNILDAMVAFPEWGK